MSGKGGDETTCELRKMFVFPAMRGFGLGRRLLMRLMDAARKRGYATCYLETLGRMWQAIELYEYCSFQSLKNPLGETGHRSCDR